MAKRFGDSGLYDRAWFRKLPPRLKCAWEYIRCRCDIIGIWNLDIEKLVWEIGEPVTLQELLQNLPVEMLGEDEVFIPGFVPFQYGDEKGRLSPKNRFHLSIARKLEARGLPAPAFLPLGEDSDPDTKGIDTLSIVVGSTQGKGEGEGKGQGQGNEEGGCGGNALHPVTRTEVQECITEWKATLRHFEIERSIGQRDQVEIARAIQQSGADWVKLAFAGARKQKAGKNFDPKQFVSLRIYLDPKRIERLVNIGAGRESADGVDWGAVFK